MKALLLGRRMAGKDQAVVTVKGGTHQFRRQPCSDCPWRKDAVGKFLAEAFRLSANTGMDGARVVDIEEAAHGFACHQSGAEKPATCAGYILRGQDAIGWRLGVALGRFAPSLVSAAGADLFNNYFDMAVANGVPADDAALDGCRPWRQP